MELEKLSAVELGNLVRYKEVSPVEVIEYFEKRVEDTNDKLNAFTYTEFDQAKERAKEIESQIMSGQDVGPLAGVPVALKDFLPSKKGWKASHGGVKSLITIDSEDSTFCKAAESAGAIVIGKTNAPSFGFKGVTDNYMYGPTCNPFDLDYNSGGSSGGSCAAVGGMVVPIAECGDAGGSTRVPSSWCNCFGFKPSAGVVPSVCRPDAWTATHPYCCSGPTARTVEDAAVIMNRMAGFDPKDPLSVPLIMVFPERYSDGKDRPLEGKKIGITYDFGIFPQPEDEIIDAINAIGEVLKQAGADVDLVDFNVSTFTLKEIEKAWLVGICIDTAIDMEIWKDHGYYFERDHRDEVPEDFFKYNNQAFLSTVMDYRKFHEVRTALLDSHVEVFYDKGYDIVLAPVTGCLPVKNVKTGKDIIGPSSIKGQAVDPLIGFSYTYLENMTGYPAASVPAGLSKSGLPIGVQVVGRRYSDYEIFNIAHVIESRHPWNHLYNQVKV